jgi:uncharacterized protein (TIGR03067 family)
MFSEATMRTMLVGLVTVLIVSGVGEAAPPSSDREREEQRRLEGTWKVLSAEANGMSLPAEVTRNFKLSFQGSTFTTCMGDQKREGSYTVDPGKNPRTIDITLHSGPDKGKTQLAIYSVLGNTLRICGAEPGRSRPTGFETQVRPGVILLMLRRLP